MQLNTFAKYISEQTLQISFFLIFIYLLIYLITITTSIITEYYYSATQHAMS